MVLNLCSWPLMRLSAGVRYSSPGMAIKLCTILRTCRVCWFFCVLRVRDIWVLPALRWRCWCCGTCGRQSVPLASAPSQTGVQALIVWWTKCWCCEGGPRRHRQIRPGGVPGLYRQAHKGLSLGLLPSAWAYHRATLLWLSSNQCVLRCSVWVHNLC